MKQETRRREARDQRPDWEEKTRVREDGVGWQDSAKEKLSVIEALLQGKERGGAYEEYHKQLLQLKTAGRRGYNLKGQGARDYYRDCLRLFAAIVGRNNEVGNRAYADLDLEIIYSETNKPAKEEKVRARFAQA